LVLQDVIAAVKAPALLNFLGRQAAIGVEKSGNAV